jgi:hypothetical protein
MYLLYGICTEYMLLAYTIPSMQLQYSISRFSADIWEMEMRRTPDFQNPARYRIPLSGKKGTISLHPYFDFFIASVPESVKR